MFAEKTGGGMMAAKQALAAAAMALGAAAFAAERAAAQAYPDKPIKIIVPSAPGGCGATTGISG